MYVPRADPGFYNRGEPNNLGYRGRGTKERSELRAKRVTSEASYERSQLRAKRVTSEASINQLGVRGEFRTPESESERNLTNYFIILLLLFY